MRIATAIELTDDERTTLQRWSRGRSTASRLVLRAKIVLAAAAGQRNDEIAVELGTRPRTVGIWRRRFAADRLAGIIKDAPRGGRPPVKRDEQARRIVTTTTQTKPADGATHWSTRTLAEHLNVSRSMVQRVWKANGLQPHRVKTFKLSNDKHFVEKLIDVVENGKRDKNGKRGTENGTGPIRASIGPVPFSPLVFSASRFLRPGGIQRELDLRRGIIHLDDGGEAQVLVFHECGHWITLVRTLNLALSITLLSKTVYIKSYANHYARN